MSDHGKSCKKETRKEVGNLVSRRGYMVWPFGATHFNQGATMRIWIQCDFGDFSVVVHHNDGTVTNEGPPRNTFESAFLLAQTFAKGPLRIPCFTEGQHGFS